jgi:hypothetical protein
LLIDWKLILAPCIGQADAGTSFSERTQTPPPQFDNPKGREAFEIMRRMRQEFLAKLSEL